jgi:MinD-like ATPase involved in chromosome partitioning or flagellar assembly
VSRWRRKSDEDVSEADAVARWDAFQNMLGTAQAPPVQNGGWRLPGEAVPPEPVNGQHPIPPEEPAESEEHDLPEEKAAVEEPLDEGSESSVQAWPSAPVAEPEYRLEQPPVPPQQQPAPPPPQPPPPQVFQGPPPQQYGPPPQAPGPQWTVQPPYSPPVQHPPVQHQQRPPVPPQHRPQQPPPQQQLPVPPPPAPQQPPWQQYRAARPSQQPRPPETPAFVWTEDYQTGSQPAVYPQQQPPPPPPQYPPRPMQPGPPQQWGPTPYMAGPPSPTPTSPPPNDTLSADALIARRRGSGWRKAVSGISRPGHGKAEWRRHLIAQATAPVRGCHRIAVISLKGGVGKTTSTVCIGATLASLRGDRVIAVDANPDRGTLSGKIPLQTTATVRNLLNDAERIQTYSDVRRYTSQSPDRLEILASETDPSVSLAFGEEDYRRVAEVLERFYNVVLTDCGTGLLHSAMAGVLALADQIVVVSSGSVDGARSASATLDWLEAHGYSSLVANGLAVINSVRPKSGGVNLDALEQHFAARCRSVTRIPYDAHLELGAEVDLAELHQSTRDALLELAAQVAAGFPRDPLFAPGQVPPGAVMPGPIVAASVIDGSMAPAPFLPPEPAGPPPGPQEPNGPRPG